jgi:hypothetical protein
MAEEIDSTLSDLKAAVAEARKHLAKIHDVLNTTTGDPSPVERLKEVYKASVGQPVELKVSTLARGREGLACC